MANIRGLLGAIAEVPGVINQGLLGPLPVDPAYAKIIGPAQVQAAQGRATSDFAAGLLRARGDPAGIAGAQNYATQGFQGRIFDLLKQQEASRMITAREKFRADPTVENLPVEGLQQAMVAQLSQQPQALDPGWRVVTEQEANQLGLIPGHVYKTNGVDIEKLDEPERGPLATATVNMQPESEFLKTVGKTAGENLAALRTNADSARSSIALSQRVRPILENEKIIAGPFAETRTQIARALGLPSAEATDTYFAQVGRQVAEIIKGFGAGTGLSDKDREFAEKIAGGQQAMTVAAMRRILNLNDQASKYVIDRYGTERGFLSETHEEVKQYFPEINVPKGPSSTAPAAALDYLRQHPETREAFRKKYGYLPDG